jgi:CubicO group peptidase (beta-lactamase class C family)
MHILSRFAAPLLLALAIVCAPAKSAMKTGMHPAKLDEIPKRMEQFVAEKQISGAVTLVARDGEIKQLAAVGESDLATHRKMRTDDLFWIASMTKPITAVAVMMLQEEGKLSVNDPVEKYLPEFKNQWMVDAKSKDEMKLIRSPRPITIRDLLTHTSGLGDVPAPRGNCSLAELVMAYSQAPLNFAPGSKWSYCNSGINTLGRIVEVVSGMSYAEFLQKRIFDSLDMDDTTFWPSERQLKRAAKSYQPGTNGLAEATVFFVKGPLSSRDRTPFPSGGLYSTARDISRFYQMMLNGGTWHGKRLLARKTVAEMTRTQTGDIKTGFTDGASWGYGFCVVKSPQGVTRMLSPGTFGHGGAYGTQSWADPAKNLIMILMIQRAKLPNADASPMRDALQDAAVGAIVR